MVVKAEDMGWMLAAPLRYDFLGKPVDVIWRKLAALTALATKLLAAVRSDE
jgi:hypothetical protein